MEDEQIKSILNDEKALIAGVDEVGRGCLCGSVVASAVVLPVQEIDQLWELGVKDSKKLSAKKRTHLCAQIKQSVTAWQIAGSGQ